jgi:hypothetical protein
MAGFLYKSHFFVYLLALTGDENLEGGGGSTEISRAVELESESESEGILGGVGIERNF